MKQINIKLEDELYEKFKNDLDSESKKMNPVLIKLIEAYLK